jgi:PAS domain S-box-containing protein
MQPGSFSPSGLSIRQRLPLLIGILLLGIIIASTLASYRGVKESALEVGDERLQNLTKQLASLLQQSTALLLTKTLTTANDAAIRAFLQSPSPATQSGASAILEQFTAPQDPLGLQVELWDTNHSLVLTLPNSVSPVTADLQTEFNASSVEPFKSVGPMQLDKNIIVVPAVAAVKDELGRPIGYLVRWRRTTLSPPSKQLTDLIGSEAALYFGNNRGDIFTNLERIVPKPQGLGSTLDVMRYSHDGNRVMGLGRPIGGTPWFVAVEFPEKPFLTQANRVLRRIVLIDLVLFIFGIVGAFALSRGITHPLNQLTDSASGISSGNYSGMVHIRRNDELGALGKAFNLMVGKVRDSQTELERKVEALGESEQRLQTVIENLSEGLVVSNPDGQLLTWNRAALEIHGFASLEECRLKLPDFANIFELSDLHGSVLDLEQWPLARIIRGERLHNLEVRIRRLESQWSRIFSYGGSVVREASGKLAAVITMSDITERKRAEEERRILASIVESSQDAIIGKTLDGVITSWNRGAQKLYGYSAEEIVGRSIATLAPLEHSHELAAILEKLRQGESIEHVETERIAKDGKRLSVSLTISPIRDGLGRITGGSTIARDITQRKQAEDARRTSELRYRRLFETAKDGILILHADTGQIVDVNPFLIEMLGYSKDELSGKELWEIGVFKDVVASKLAFEELRHRGYIRYENLPLETHAGLVRQVEFVSNSYLVGESRVIQCNVRDITERWLAEEELRRTNQRLEKALAELQTKTHELASMTEQLWQAAKLATMGELAASVAHELNNPLATLALHAESLLDRLNGDDPKRRAVLVIEQEVERMASLVSNLLLFSRRSRQQNSTVDVREELSNSLEFMQYHLRSHKITVVTEFDSGLPNVHADRQQLRQLFLNLLTNSSDAMPQGGRLRLQARQVTLDGGAPALQIEFSDTGIGIDPDDLQKLWEPFFTTKPEGEGTGLGLPICRRIVEEHRGTIDIESERGKGTTVRIILPGIATGANQA